MFFVKTAQKLIFLLAILFLIVSACSEPAPVEKPTFKSVVGIRFIEVRREFDNGISFNSYGFQQEPEWILEFMSDDSVKIYSPFEKKFLHYFVIYDRNNIFNMAREWVRLKHVSKDSLTFQLLQVNNKVVNQKRSNVLMKFFSENYLKSKQLDPKQLQKPNQKDTAFIKSLIAKANKYPDAPDSTFAARKPVTIISNTDAIKVKQSHTTSNMLEASRADEYLNPEYKISITGAYEDFSYSFSVVVDEKGKMHLGQYAAMDEFRESQQRLLNALIEGYLHKYLTIVPGRTLGMPHASEIMIYLKGKK
ncbi:MAG: hypothetical protein EOO07_28160 [Chitinophagaceae bacterium]|nr:MAG: hypothetical protein EOO07_28160 [Chitinophagaceae bacterium]